MLFLTFFKCLVQWYTNKKFFLWSRCQYLVFKPMKKLLFCLFIGSVHSFFFLLFVSYLIDEERFLFSFLRLRVLYFYKIIIEYIIRSISFFLYVNTSSFQVDNDDLFELSLCKLPLLCQSRKRRFKNSFVFDCFACWTKKTNVKYSSSSFLSFMRPLCTYSAYVSYPPGFSFASISHSHAFFALFFHY